MGSLPRPGELSWVWGCCGRCPERCSFTSTAGTCLAASRCPECASSQGCCSLIWVKTYSSTTPNPEQLQIRRRGKPQVLYPQHQTKYTHLLYSLHSLPFPPHFGLEKPPSLPRQHHERRLAPLPPSSPASLFQRCQKDLRVRGPPPLLLLPQLSLRLDVGTGGADAAPLHFRVAGACAAAAFPPTSGGGHGVGGGEDLLPPPRAVSGGDLRDWDV